jgi:hypothetical protein
MPILTLRRTLRRASCAHAVSLGQEYGRPSSAPVIELVDVAKLLDKHEAAEDP